MDTHDPDQSDDLMRSMVQSARFRFSPAGASIRQQALEKVIEQNLASAAYQSGARIEDLSELKIASRKLVTFRKADVKLAIDALIEKGRLLLGGSKKHPVYALSPTAHAEAEKARLNSDAAAAKVVTDLFGGAVGDAHSAYSDAFFCLLCTVFSRLAETYVLIIAQNKPAEALVTHPELSAITNDVLKSNRVPDEPTFRYGIQRFFRESTPAFDHLKWNMAQNFYVSRALGIDAPSFLLSTEIFHDTSLYCDTNVLIAALSPNHQHHGSVQELSKACAKMRMRMCATQPTMEELKSTVAGHSATLKRVWDRIPDQTVAKVRSFLLDTFVSERIADPSLDIDAFLERFQDAQGTVRESLGLEVVDDKWFIDAENDDQVRRLSEALSRKFLEIRHRPKRPAAALHDAMVLLWVSKENAEGSKSWLLTLDLSLVNWRGVDNTESFSNTVTLDALIQWITPLSAGEANEEHLAGIYAEALRLQLLPSETFIDLRDFQVFAEMGIESRQLPAEDVEACIREMRKVGPSLDPGKAEDREKLGRVVQRFFADPGAKFHRTIHDVQERNSALQTELADEKRIREEVERDLKKALTEKNDERTRLEQRIDAETVTRRAGEERIAKLEKAQADREVADRRKALVRSAWLRLSLGLPFFLAAEVGIGWVIWDGLEGQNAVQKFIGAWEVWAAVFAGSGIVTSFVMGKERVKALMWWKE